MMAAEFIGFNVLVTLRAPLNAQVQGEVSNVIGQRLMLRNVTLCWNGQYLPTYSVEGPDIADLSLLPSTEALSQAYAASQTQVASSPAINRMPRWTFPLQPDPNVGSKLHVPTQQPLVDPAILSFSKPQLGRYDSAPIHPVLQSQHGDARASVALSQTFNELELNAHGKTLKEHHVAQKGSPDGPIPTAPQSTKPTEGKKRLSPVSKASNELTIDPVNEHGDTSNVNLKSKGWRQTACEEPSSPPIRSSQTATRLKDRRRRKKRQSSCAEGRTTWATEDAANIQEMGDFDFEGNLSKFDKGRVFQEIRNDDTTADEERLVSFNKRKFIPGTAGGRNLHWTENVLSAEDSEIGGSDEDHVETKVSGRHSPHDWSKASTRAQNSRNGSAMSWKPSDSLRINSTRRNELRISRAASPQLGKRTIPTSPINGPSSLSGSLRLATTNQICPSVTPLQALEVEQIAVAEFGLTEDIITENAGRGIAEGAVRLLPSSSESTAKSVLVLTGNHRTGTRAIVAARHLRNRGHRVTVCMIGSERELLESCRKQLTVFRKVGGRSLGWKELATRLSTSELFPDLVVDALLGMHVAVEDLRADDRRTAFDMISWVNGSNAAVLSVDVPSGVSASSGEVTVTDGAQLYVNSKSVICLGAPKIGVINAILSGGRLSSDLTVADIGIPQIVWRKYGTRRRHGIDFGNRWVVSLRFQMSST